MSDGSEGLLPLPDGFFKAFDIMSNWRSSHAFPLNTMTVGLRKHAKEVSGDALVAQRLKRASSIIDKLRREQGMSLDRMQDIGGCRAVVPTIADVYELEQRLLKSSMKHELKRQTDYIFRPKASGYRGIHLIYRYRSDRSEVYNSLSIEVQIRSALQHAWATAVETVGTFLDQALKASRGSEEWLEFFRYVSRALAAMEGAVQEDQSDDITTVVAEVQRLSESLNVRGMLQQYGRVVKQTNVQGSQKADYFLMTLRPEQGELDILSFSPSQLAEATDLYQKKEQELAEVAGAQVVLVRAESVAALRKAFPNYFLDTDLFLEALALIEAGDI